MCVGGGNSNPHPADTSAQQAELQRQNQLLLQQAEQRRVEELQAAEALRQQDAQRFQDMLTQQQAEYQRQTDAANAASQQNRLDQQTAYEQQQQSFAAALAQQQQEAATAAQSLKDYQTQVAQQMQDANDAQAQREAAAEAQLESERAQDRAATLQAAQARADQVQQYNTGRQGLIDQFTNDVNSNYAGFDNSFFDQFRQNFINNYAPQLQQQYNDDQKSLVYGFANSGNLNSTAAAHKFGDLDRLQVQRQTAVASAASDATLNFKDQLDQQRRDALASAFQSGAVGREDLPDGVTDVNGQLGSIASQLNALKGDVRQRATTPNVPQFSDLSSLTGNLNLNFNAPNVYQPYGRFGGFSTGLSSSGGPTSYVVR